MLRASLRMACAMALVSLRSNVSAMGRTLCARASPEPTNWSIRGELYC